MFLIVLKIEVFGLNVPGKGPVSSPWDGYMLAGFSPTGRGEEALSGLFSAGTVFIWWISSS